MFLTPEQRRLQSRLRRLERGELYLRRGRAVEPSGTRQRPSVSALSNGFVDPRTPGFVASGSIAPSIYPSFTGTVTDTTITWAWSGPLRHSDGSVVVIPASTLTVSVLNPSTTYYFYPFYATKGCGIGFVVGNAGTPAFAWSTTSDKAAQLQTLKDREPLSNGAMSATTLASPGSSTVMGGGSTIGVSGGCPRDHMMVESEERGVIRCDWLRVGERIASPSEEGWTEVIGVEITSCQSFILLRTDAGDEIEISPETPQPLFDGNDEPASLLTLSNRALVRQPGGGSGYITKLEWVEAPEGKRVVMACAPHHLFWCGRHGPMIAAHNVISKL